MRTMNTPNNKFTTTHPNQTNVWIDKLSPTDKDRFKRIRKSKGLLTPRFVRDAILHYLDYCESQEQSDEY